MSSYTIINNGTIYTPREVIKDGVILLAGQRIQALGRLGEVSLPSDKSVVVIDVQGGWILPGFIDQHLHGGGGADTMDQSYEAICTIAREHAKHGVTALCPATMAAPDQDIKNALAAVAEAVEKGTGGAKVLGAHVEGPAINVLARGAHEKEFVENAPPSIERLQDYHAASRGTIRIWTMAPELPGGIEFIQAARRLGIKISIGHTQASFEQVNQAIAAGASGATHLFNGMSGFHYRQAGAAMAILASKGKIMAEIIADGAHVHPAAIYMALATMRPENVVLITDCMRPAGLALLGSFELAGQTVTIQDGRLLTAEGKLCGSLLTMDRAVRNMQDMLGMPFAEAIALATINPARSLGIAERKGSLEVGKDADIVICDPSLKVLRTIVEGETVYMV